MGCIFETICGQLFKDSIYHNDYSDYHNYSNHSDYSDAAERKRRRIAALKQETESAARNLADYKSGSVNPKLSDDSLKRTPAMTVSQEKMDADAKKKIDREMQQRVSRETADAAAQLKEVDRLLERIYQLEEEEDI